MQGTTRVINATKVWRSDIIAANGQNLGRIDGTDISVVVLDSGIDAGHPDLDYRTKTIMNLKSDNGEPPWIEMENSDTSSGHGSAWCELNRIKCWRNFLYHRCTRWFELGV